MYKLFIYKSHTHIYIYIYIYIYKQDSAMNNPQGLIYHKTQPTNLNIVKCYLNFPMKLILSCHIIQINIKLTSLVNFMEILFLFTLCIDMSYCQLIQILNHRLKFHFMKVVSTTKNYMKRLHFDLSYL